MMMGFSLAAVGLDSITGQLRLTFGFTELLNGFDFLIAVIGLFGIGEILLTMEEGLNFRGGNAKIDLGVVLETWKELPTYWLTSLRSCIIGCWMGITPAGATPASFMSYGIAKRVSRNGKISATANRRRDRAGDCGACRRHLRLVADAVARRARLADGGRLLGGLLIWGLQPGPMLFVEQKEFVWGLIASMYLGNRRPDCRAHLRADLRRDLRVPSASSRRSFSCCARSAPIAAARSTYVDAGFGVSATCSRNATTLSPRWCWPSCLATRPRRRSGNRCSGRRVARDFLLNPLVSTIMVLGLIALFWSAIQEGYTRLRTAAA